MDVVRTHTGTHTEKQFDLNIAPDKPGLLMRRALYDRAAAEAGYAI